MSCLKNFIMTTIKKLNQKLITHDGSFHTDDIFAAATLSIYLEKKGETFEIIRTRNEEIIKNGDYVFDVGGFYDEEKNRFDHHQVNGAGKRDNGIEYASFGLVWKKFGGELCNGETEAELIDQKLVQPIDAGDNGVNLVELKREVIPYFIQYAFNAFRPGWKDVSEKALFVGFLECVQMAKNILTREIGRARDITEAQKIIFTIYRNAENKKIIVLDKKYPWEELMQNYPEPIFVVYPRIDNSWGVEGVAASKFSVEKRKKFPDTWAGLRNGELQEISKVPDALFCHRGLFMAVAKSKEGAVKLAQIALES
ncbi:MAG: Metal-dependent protein hydrolase [Candidatus Nomurabacteria bacterium GW2011_GWC2_41_8]|uniref:Metal-dependent protein hydrolase n=3 Tax=Candidatus Nomuraibacteriota TaxID=1752729 RepID=A0A0G0ZNM7_9BACT|nr:MAG: Metal-dependent protein hydrolase [Candidatus Nomurabacteria bacterium GW2011_GWA2_41_25]KKS23636.1 MAG: Metal-dependent protein hydrolase [Candidatus Nomurabacteria bacterium GW2011_GWC2_41_8]